MRFIICLLRGNDRKSTMARHRGKIETVENELVWHFKKAALQVGFDNVSSTI